tara:strand:- start:23216 stop:25120 length:1905 start_codon:yes stop_codon:yes gene_type:complete
MTIKRYIADSDNTITNAFKPNLETRGTGSNMGQADVLEVFSIYGQGTSTSVELERILVQFPISQITTDRASGVVPASGSVNFILKLANAPHAGQTPRDFQLVASAISQSWQEGTGLDMENYTDLTYDGIGSNWIASSGTDVAATATVTWNAGDRPEIGDTITIIDAAGLSKAYIAAAAQDLTVDPPEWYASNTTTTQVDSLQACIESAKGHNGSITVSQDGTGLIMTLAQTTTGPTGNKSIVVAGATSGQLSATDFTGGSNYTPWTTEGGDYYTDTSSSYTASFDTGLENLELDITPLVEQWLNSAGNILGSKSNYGVEIYLNSAYEGSSSSNPDGATTSYYTKKFFARQSEFFFKRPYVEAQWESIKQDDRGSFYFSSSLAPAADNLNTIYLYNYVRGVLRNIPAVGTGLIFAQLYSGSSDNTAPSGSALILVSDDTHVNSHSPTYITGGYVSPGIYSASFALTGAATLTKIFDVWCTGTTAGSLTTLYHTGTIDTNVQLAKGYTTGVKYVLSMPNLQDIYYTQNTARLRLFVRKKNWSPNIYTVVNSAIPAHLIPSASYRVKRVIDNYEVVSYGTGSLKYTGLSYDVSGNYFDLDMKLFEPGYEYALQYVFKDENTSTYHEQPYLFKFKVKK